MTATLILMAILAFLSVYSYFIYPLVLIIARRAAGAAGTRRPVSALGSASRSGLLKPGVRPAGFEVRDGAPWDEVPYEPRISLLITAHNEEARIRAKIENSLKLAYDPAKLEILVASDASTDNTDAIVATYPTVKLVRVALRKGKEHAQKHGILASTGDILVFSDVATLLDGDALRLLARNFRDPAIGALSSTDKLIAEDGKPSGEGLYVRYEMLLRRLESDVRGLVGLSGSFFAARRAVCMQWAEDLPSDFNTVMNCVRLGYRAVSDDAVIGYYRDIQRGQSEFQRKVRTLVRGITAFFANLELLDFRRFGFFSFQLLSHKLMRWLAPVFMILLIPATLAGMADGNRAACAAAVLQACFYALALAGYAVPALRNHPLVKVPFFFAQVNAAILAAWFRYLRGDRITLWAPSKR
jgi:cellulose synthase/poly-beta-1,6-N-acetylglucosamine synthase-like glycosyltransferase